MKTKNKRLLAGIAGLGMLLSMYSFANSEREEETPLKKYEVIRIVNGESMHYDTILPVQSSFTPNDYLTFLGFENDPTIQVINLSQLNFEEEVNQIEPGSEAGERKIVVISENSERTLSGNEEIEVMSEIHTFSTLIDGEQVRIELDLEGLDLDSLILINQMDESGDSVEFHSCKTMFLIENVEEGDSLGQVVDFKGIDASGADFHEINMKSNGSSEIAIWNEGKDITMVLVTDVDPNSKMNGVPAPQRTNHMIDLHIYPNPSQDNVTISADFDGSANGSISVTDVQGKLILQLELGQIEGTFSQVLDVKGWEKGVYLIQLNHGANSVVNRLIID